MANLSSVLRLSNNNGNNLEFAIGVDSRYRYVRRLRKLSVYILFLWYTDVDGMIPPIRELRCVEVENVNEIIILKDAQCIQGDSVLVP